ncbi:hypothetical protein PF008_g19960 [Phytophthora fragariae]|uniref:Uncharacterized protein n=1 Tax=Phytophthora fragariae TaxID=53985 RepID=A0A6G0R1Y7_9STRA|nr:hypothetical protein PF008_g19960 [Phytophthora fragariae]
MGNLKLVAQNRFNAEKFEKFHLFGAASSYSSPPRHPRDCPLLLPKAPLQRQTLVALAQMQPQEDSSPQSKDGEASCGGSG